MPLSLSRSGSDSGYDRPQAGMRDHVTKTPGVGREGLRRSLDHPHSEGATLSDAGLEAWRAMLPPDDSDLVDVSAGTPVRWLERHGWVPGAAPGR